MMDVIIRFKSGEEEEIKGVVYVSAKEGWGERGALFYKSQWEIFFYNFDSVESIVSKESVEAPHENKNEK